MSESNPNSRLEAFCDSVFAIALTLLIIDIRIPSTADINTTADFWQALNHILPSITAFILSFIVIFIAWVNHHNFLKKVNKSSASFIYSNGFLLLSIVFIPFPSSLLGEYILTNHAAPAVILYDATLSFQAFGWILLYESVLKNHLGRSEKATSDILANRKFSYFAFVLYSFCTILAIWFPLTIAIITSITWIFWLIMSIRIKND